MFANKCSFCQYDNIPGSRFCADCGSPLHLKVCQACGKVSDVTATDCEFCKAPFPDIDVAAAGSGKPATVTPASVAPPVTAAVNNPLPLIIIALVAGGLPFLWIYREHLPAPKTWGAQHVESSTVPISPSAPSVAPVVAAPVKPAPAPTAESKPAETAATEAKEAPPRASTPPPRKPPKPAPSQPCTDAVAALGLCTPTKK